MAIRQKKKEKLKKFHVFMGKRILVIQDCRIYQGYYLQIRLLGKIDLCVYMRVTKMKNKHCVIIQRVFCLFV